MTVPEQAVEAAAVAIALQRGYSRQGLEFVSPELKAELRLAARAALEAALPLMGVEQTELEKARALNLVLSEAAVIHDSYGVQGSDFDTCLVCQAGGAPGIPFKHAADCPVGRAEESANQWCREHQEEVTELEAEIANLKAIYALPAQSGSVQCREDVARAICKSRSCEGINCCQWPANMARRNPRDCPVDRGGYNDAADAVLALPKPAGQPVEGDAIIERCAKVAEQQTSWSQTIEETDHNDIYTGNYRTVQRTGPRWRDGKAIASAIRALSPASPQLREKP